MKFCEIETQSIFWLYHTTIYKFEVPIEENVSEKWIICSKEPDKKGRRDFTMAFGVSTYSVQSIWSDEPNQNVIGTAV